MLWYLSRAPEYERFHHRIYLVGSFHLLRDSSKKRLSFGIDKYNDMLARSSCLTYSPRSACAAALLASAPARRLFSTIALPRSLRSRQVP